MLGFRKYAVIIKTLLHELAHNEFTDHGRDFLALNSTLTREYDAVHMRRIQTTHTLHGGGGGSSTAPAFFRGWDDAREEEGEEKKKKDGRKLGSL